MTLMRDALLKVMSRRKTDQSRADAVMAFLGLDKDDGIVSMSDVSHMLAWVRDAMYTIDREGLDVESETGEIWDNEDLEDTDKVFERLLKILPAEFKEDEE